jgi:hypothetical protein
MTFTDNELLDIAVAPSTAPMDTRHAPGIYFDLPEDEYHGDDALGSTSIKAAAVDIYEFQFDRLYGEDKDTDALHHGRAVHLRMLDGIKALRDNYCGPAPADLIPEGALDTISDLKAWLSSQGQRGLSGKTKPELIKAVLEIEPKTPIVQVFKEQWAKDNIGKIVLPEKRWVQIETAAQWAQRDPLLSAVMRNGTFVEGAPEVSVFYEDRGLRLKARFDRLLRHAIIDIKTFAPWFDGEIERASIKVIDRMHYDIQAACYLRAWERARELFAAGLVFGQEPFPGFLKECFSQHEPKWIWVMIKSKGAPQPLVVDWCATFARRRAFEKVEETLEKYIQLRDEFGEDKEWVPMRPAVILQDHDLPQYFGL